MSDVDLVYVDAWITEWFRSAQARNGGVIRRDRKLVDTHTSLRRVITAARSHGWHVIENGGQVIVLCNGDAVQLHC